ncbi:hypothetical protein NBRC110019_28150 [Neptunitalea chrysea]|uniref:histidine kinase n=1 Tax=Neptunitalea chrysea TaxID=1647581 RepID=A0A9W6B8Z8_9FLAO|nr:ATP-binding protein [Neptunitalea chrysea]GLB53774.1 hypothetical protein NBRC110019_28150 [Neptunitalea chrysea]
MISNIVNRHILIVFVILIFFSGLSAWCQNQQKADSLKSIVHSKLYTSEKHLLDVLGDIATYESVPDSSLYYSKLALDQVTKIGDESKGIGIYMNMGVAYRLKGSLNESLKYLFKCAKLADKYQYQKDMAMAYGEIASVYASNNDLTNAAVYEEKAIVILRAEQSRFELTGVLINAGYTSFSLGDLEQALVYYNEAEVLSDSLDVPIYKAYTIGNRALVYQRKGDLDNAEKDLKQALELLADIGDEYAIADYSNQLGHLYAQKGLMDEAIKYLDNGVEIATRLDLKEQLRDAHLLLSQLYEKESDFEEALLHRVDYMAYKDSIENTANTKKMADLRTEYEVSLKDKEIIELEKKQLISRIYMITSLLLLILAVVLLLFFRQRWKNSKLLAESQRKSHNERITNVLKTQESKALQAMVTGRENERKRLAKELHNHFGSLMATIKVNLSAVEDVGLPNYTTLSTLVDQACNDIRNLSHSLNIGIEDDFGLVPALKELINHLKQVNGLQAEFSATMCEETLVTENEIVIYRIVQELVSNVLKHAKATKLSVQLICFEEEGMVNILVEDNGTGFDFEKVTKTNSGGMGIMSLEKLIHDLHGDIKYDSNPNSGTTVNIDLPISFITISY